MGGLRKYMKITWITALLGSLALIGFPGFSGFFSKDAIIEAVGHSQITGSGYAHWLLILGVFVTALYSFRMFFIVFHGDGPRHYDPHHHHADDEPDSHASRAAAEKPHESPAVVTLPLILLAIPSVFVGWYAIEPMLFGDFFKGVLHVAAVHDTLGEIGEHYKGQMAFILHGLMAWPFWLAMAGVAAAWYVFMMKPVIAQNMKIRFDWLYAALDKKYWFDELYQWIFAKGSLLVGKIFWRAGDQTLIDGIAVNGSARSVGMLAQTIRWIQSGYLYHYAIAMILGLMAMLYWFVIR